MKEQLQQPIEWDQVQKGDVIRAERDWGVVQRLQGEAVSVDAHWIALSDWIALSEHESSSFFYIYPNEGYTLTLISRPAPERPPWSRWRDPVTGAGYVRTDGLTAGYVWVIHGHSDAADVFLYLDLPRHVEIIDRLVPWTDQPAQPDPILCKRCDQPIWEGVSGNWYHLSHRRSRCDGGVPVIDAAAATPKATS